MYNWFNFGVYVGHIHDLRDIESNMAAPKLPHLSSSSSRQVRFLCLDILVSVQCVPTLFLRGRHMVFVTNIERTVRRTILVIFARIGPWKGGQTWSHMSENVWTNKRNRSPLLYPALSQRITLRRRRLLHSNKRLSAL